MIILLHASEHSQRASDVFLTFSSKFISCNGMIWWNTLHFVLKSFVCSFKFSRQSADLTYFTHRHTRSRWRTSRTALQVHILVVWVAVEGLPARDWCARRGIFMWCDDIWNMRRPPRAHAAAAPRPAFSFPLAFNVKSPPCCNLRSFKTENDGKGCGDPAKRAPRRRGIKTHLTGDLVT